MSRRERAAGTVVVGSLALAAALRLLLVWQSDVISVDGVQYVEAARLLARGDWRRGLGSFYPPGYPLAIAALEPGAGDWERAGVAVSLLAGVATLLPLAGIARAAGLRGVAFAAVLLGYALSPYPARYAASVRSEALYALFLVTAVWAVARGGRVLAAAAGLSTGLAYLVRPEGLGLVVPLGAWLARRRGRGDVVALGLATALVASPYVAYLRADTGHWTISRKASNVLTTGIHAATGAGEVVAQGASDQTSLIAVVRDQWAALGRKLFIDAFWTFVAFAECLHPLLVPFVVGGIVVARVHFPAVSGLLHRVIWFYVAALAVLYTDRRFYAALVPLALVWAGAGVAWAWPRAGRLAPALALAAGIILVTKNRFHDESGWVRQIGEEIARRDPARPLVAARDLRVPYYAHGRRAEVVFPLDAEHALALLDGGPAWLVLTDRDAGPPVLLLLERHAGRANLVSTIPEKGGRSARLYRIRPLD